MFSGKSSNPALKGFETSTVQTGFGNMSMSGTASGMMTVQGTVNKTALLLMLLFLSGSIGWSFPQYAMPMMMFSGIVSLGIAIGLAFKPEYASIGAPIYAIVQGVTMGAITVIFETIYPGIAFQAMGITLGVLAMMLFLYTSRIIKVTQKLRMGIFAATGGIFIFYMGSLFMSFLGFQNPAFGNGMMGIAFSLFVVGIAALNLVIDFAFIEEASNAGAPQHMEWYGAFVLMVTLVWLYIEILNLLAKLQSRD
ncbi:Bax inhibitor-1/YccA family protein [Anaerolineales bacterium HSG25]|nr:Bax inhibitor-1/YccA family protein [Anaerolineales bacterium HSG25]